MNRSLIHKFCLVTSVSTVLLLCAGALVTSTGSGLAVPDWPLSYGQFFPDMVGGVLYEHGHRLIAGTVALLTILQTYLIHRYEPRNYVRYLAYASVGIVLTQASLGGMTVLFRLPPQISIAHACLAQLFFCTTVVLTLMTSKRWDQVPSIVSLPRWTVSRLPKLLIGLNVAFFLQLLIGAIMRHNHAGLAIPDFPLVFGGLVPPEFTFPITIHYLHRIGALIVVIYSAFASYRIQKSYSEHLDLFIGSGVLLALLSVQVMLASVVIWMKKPVPITMLHLAVGALCFATSIWLTTRAFRLRHLIVKPNKLESSWPFFATTYN